MKTSALYKRVVIVSAICCCLTKSIQQPPATPKQDEFDKVIFDWTRTFAEVLQITKQKHYHVTNLEDCMMKAIDSFLTCLDPHSSFLNPKTYKSILETTSGEFFGIGVIIDNTRNSKDKFLTVIDTIQDGPADKAGAKPLDKIIEIDGKLLEGMSTDEATTRLKGERNTIVHIKVLRENQSDYISLDIKRDVVKEQASLAFYLEDHNIYYLSLNTFSENSVQQITELLKKAQKKKYKGLILDLRNNSGGLLTAAIDIAGLFLEKNSLVVVTKDKDDKETERYATSKKPVANSTLPIFILVNNYTASAAEILAGCLKIHSEELAKKTKNGEQKKLMVFLVGSRTYGKGSVQEVIPISNNYAIKITSSLYFLPQDISIQGIGIEPDFIIERTFGPPEQVKWFNKFYGQERALGNYIKVDKNADKKVDDTTKDKDNKVKSWIERSKEALTSDNQFRQTISLINLLHTAKTTCPAQINNRLMAIQFLKSNYLTDDKITMVELKL